MPLRQGPSRRDFLTTGSALITGLGIGGLPGSVRARTPAGTRLPPLRSCIFVFYYGGPSHLDTYDMKPGAPASVRGEFSPVATTVPGIQICEHMPHMARMMDRVTLIRSMHHTNRLHDSASTEVFTGRQGPQGDREEFLPIPQFFPCHGAVLSALSRREDSDVTHAVLPWLFHNVIDVPCQGGGFLGQQFDPFIVSGNPAQAGYRVEVLDRPEQLSLDRVRQRRELLTMLDGTTDIAGRAISRRLAQQWDQAYELLRSTRLPEALRIDDEPDSIRELYGRREFTTEGSGGAYNAGGRKLRGQNLLMARRLVEAGVPFVNVNDFRQQGANWDSHANNFAQHRDILLPPSEQALAALIEDLEQRGLLETTLVVATGEFGRTPTINGNAGRDHWPDCYTTLLAGGGVGGGQVIGASDRTGAYPESQPVTPADLAATIYWRFGVDPRSEIHDPNGRPYRLSDGRPLVEAFV